MLLNEIRGRLRWREAHSIGALCDITKDGEDENDLAGALAGALSLESLEALKHLTYMELFFLII